MNFFTDTKIAVRIAVALAVPVLGFAIYGGILVVEKRSTANSVAMVQELADIAPTISAVVHEMQKERGLSAVFIGSKGAQAARDNLTAQRRETDTARSTLTSELASFDVDSYGSGFASKVSNAINAMTELVSKRQSIDSLSMTTPQMASYYTPTIGKMLTIIEQMGSLSTEAEITQSVSAYTSYLQGKERAGVERAMGAAGFGAGRFAPATYNKFVSLIAQQETYFSQFAIFATSEQVAFNQSTVSGSAVEEVNRLRKIAIDSPQTGHTDGVQGPYWFGAITKKIDLLKKVEDRIAADLTATAGAIGSAAQFSFMLFAVITGVLAATTLGLSFVIAKGISGPLGQIETSMAELSNGNKDIEIAGAERGDEVGNMAQAVEVFRQSMIKSDALAAEQAKEQEVKEQRAQEMERLASDFESGVTSVLGQVGEATDSMKTSADSMSATAEQTRQQTATVAAATEEASTNVQTVASAAEQLSTSINDISQHVAKSSEIASKAVQEADATNQAVRGLEDAAAKIGEIVDLISDIAEQTNLLALNATIEAARAGDSGKGFAVVASEVKNLASQTAKATDQIASQIGAIQSETQGAVSAIEGIGTIIREIDEIAATIAAAVEEQGVATQEISRNVQEAASGTSSVSENIIQVNEAADETGKTANEVAAATTQLTTHSEALQERIMVFLNDVKAA